MNDRDAVARQLGRGPKPFRVAARCPFGLPSVIENERARNMPTSLWVTCPSLVAAISRVESTGGVREAGDAVGEEAVEAIHEEHRALYGTRVAGVRDGGNVKCLHAFTALQLAGAIPNPVAEWTLGRLERPYPEGGCCSQVAEE
ncbi:MAG: FIG004853: possible toxin to DivIC [uncultured Rubrobacteraceae bacterium]|uniref:FIG004853: possible toxin to DivIC n=1 Tax=uncultured Rubrobacteraceae bacterium TaxID=349277 RepID=A0A6J4QVG6_9ACTN|nr:MAG: FIG004853: possible toxin to DivIC [uncultured Rubrobacteraceae bacterium]